MRDGDEDRTGLTALGIATATGGEIRSWDAAEPADAVARSAEAPGTGGFWLHLDADVLDPSVMPAVDSPDPGGLLPAELAPLLRALVRSERCVGFNPTVYDPDLDPDGGCGTLLGDLVEDAFAA
jgi:arginase